MPEDTRPVSQGGNRGIDDEFSRNAPQGKFRVVWVDTFDGSDGVDGDYDSLAEAKKKADGMGGEMSKAYVYDSAGRCVHSAGRY